LIFEFLIGRRKYNSKSRTTETGCLRLVVCVLVGIGVVALWPGEREPEYNGKKLSEWIEAMDGMYSSENVDAIQQIGTNALPLLLKWIQYEQPSWRKRGYIVYSKLPSRLQRSATGDWILGLEFESRKLGARNAFYHLGPQASNAVPDLYVLTLNPRTSQKAFECLEAIGDPAVPALNRLTDAADGRIRTRAFEVLCSISLRH
jgi:hypothetical protein